MDAVKSFNAELSSLYEVKPPISKAKMTAITRGAIKAIKFYKHVVQSVEKFILKCKSEYKVPGLYVIDSIVRQSRHQFGAEKDVFAPRFAKNMQQTFVNLFKCPPEDKSKIIRVLNLWQKNQVFAPDVIQPLFDLADPNNPIHKELATATPLQSNGMNAGGNAAIVKGSPALQKTPTKGSQQGIDGSHLGGANLNLSDPNVLAQFQQLQRLLSRSGGDSSVKSDGPVHFDKKLLDFDYGDDDDEQNSSPKQGPGPNDSVASLLTNPEVLRQLQTLQQTMTAGPPPELDMDKLRKLQEMKQQEEEFDKHLAQTVPNLPFAAECEFKPSSTGYYLPPGADLSQPPPGYKSQQQYDLSQQQSMDNDIQFVGGDNDNGVDVEVITLDHGDSRSPTPPDDRYRRRRSRSRERSRDRRDRDRRSRRSRSRSRSRRHRSRSRDRNKVKETEKDKERKKRGLPTIKKDNLSVCSTTLWVGHLSKLVHQEDLSNTFGEFGDIVSIDLIPPRGCAFIVMHRRQDATRCLTKLKNHLLHGKAITLAWAPGKGVKGKDLKDYWEGDLGVSYIPWSKLKPDIDLEMLEDGGMIDEDTMPQWMKAKVASISNQQTNNNTIDGTANFLQQISGDPSNNRQVDTSQPPPVPGSSLLQPPPMALPMVSPFQFNNRLLGPVGMNVPPGMLPNIPIGVPPPAIMQNLGIGSPFQGPPGLMPQLSLNAADKNQSTPDMNINDSLVAQSFGMIPQLGGLSTQPQQQHQHDDNMDIEMEDEKPERQPLLLSEQLEASLGYNRRNDDDLRRSCGGIDDRMDRNRRSSLSRERDRDRGGRFNDDFMGRGGGGGSSGDDNNNRRNRRKDDRRDRPNRWGDRDESIDRNDRREREKTLNDRLQQMANESAYPSTHDARPPPPPIRDEMPPALLDRRIFPPLQGPPINPDLEELYSDEYDHLNGPPIDDYPPPIMDRGDFPGPPMHHRMHRDEYEQDRFMRGGGGGGRRDFREPRNRGPPEFYPGRDGGFGGPRPPIMRAGPDFAPRPPPMMRPMGPHKFHPRGPGMRGPRPNAPWKDRPSFGGPPRFDHPPDYYRGPNGPPGMYDEPPAHMRHRGGRFDDRRRPPRPDFQDNNSAGDNSEQRFNEKRNSRWGDSPKRAEDDNNDGDGDGNDARIPEQGATDEQQQEHHDLQENRGGNTPLHDEPFNREGGDAVVQLDENIDETLQHHENPDHGLLLVNEDNIE